MTKRKTLEALLFELGFGNRRECRRLIREGYVSLGGEVCEDPYFEYPSDIKTVTVADEEVEVITDLYLIMHKPAGYECSHRAGLHPSVYSLFPERYLSMELQSAGRLDVDTTGILFFSNDGQFIHHLESPRKAIDKFYVATLDRPLSPREADKLRAGILLKDEKLPFVPSLVEVLDDGRVRVAIREGRYHQVKRMFIAVGAEVTALFREAVGEMTLGTLQAGEWRHLNVDDFAKLGWRGKP